MAQQHSWRHLVNTLQAQSRRVTLHNGAVAAWKQSHQRNEVCQGAPVHVFQNYGDLQRVPQVSSLCM